MGTNITVNVIFFKGKYLILKCEIFHTFLLLLLKLRFPRRTLSSGSLAVFSAGFGFTSVVVSVLLVRLLSPKVAISQFAPKLNVKQ